MDGFAKTLGLLMLRAAAALIKCCWLYLFA